MQELETGSLIYSDKDKMILRLGCR